MIKKIVAYSFISLLLIGTILSGADPNCTNLYNASQQGESKKVEELLKNGVDVNSYHDNNQTPLHAAALNGHTNVVAILLWEGANLNTENCVSNNQSSQSQSELHIPMYDNGFTPLYWPVIKGHEDTVRVLLDLGADVNARDKSGRTPLHLAILWRKIMLVDLLISEGADVTLQDIKGKSAVHFVVEQFNVKILIKLMNTNPILNQRTILGETPLDLALKLRNKKIINILRNAGVSKKLRSSY